MEHTLSAISSGLAALVEQTAPLAVGVEGRPRMGSSGFVWKSGVVVTADHAIRRDEDIPVILPSGQIARGQLAGRDPGTDIAVLRVEGTEAPQFARGGDLRAGEIVVAVGRHQPGVLATMGIVSTAGGPWRTWRGGQLDSLLRLDLAAYPRSSGSVLVDTGGRVAGMLTGGLTRTAPVAVPLATVDRVVGELLTHGQIARGYLGVGLQPIALPAAYSQALGREQQTAVIVLSVEPAGPAHSAGFAIGDVIAELGGRPVTDTDDVQTALQGAIGRQLTAVVFRAAQKIELPVTAAERRG